MKKKPESKTKKSAKKGKNHLFLVALLILSGVFISTAFVLFISLIPMFVAFFVDRSKKKYKAITVGAMNIAGCTPFLLDLWSSDHTLDKAFSIILNPMAISVVYAAAGAGYLIDWTMTIIIANILYQRGQARIKALESRQGELIERWGIEVNGTIPLDHDGFPMDAAAPPPTKS